MTLIRRGGHKGIYVNTTFRQLGKGFQGMRLVLLAVVGETNEESLCKLVLARRWIFVAGNQIFSDLGRAATGGTMTVIDRSQRTNARAIAVTMLSSKSTALLLLLLLLAGVNDMTENKEPNAYRSKEEKRAVRTEGTGRSKMSQLCYANRLPLYTPRLANLQRM